MITIEVYDADPEDIRVEGEGGQYYNDDSVAIANAVHQLLQEDFGYLEVSGVGVDVGDASVDECADFPD